jgi:hypothetical protein
MKRALGLIMIAGLFLGATACGASGGSDSKSDDTTKVTADTGSDTGSDSGDSDGDTTGSGNADVKAYCKAVDEYVEKAKEIMDDPTGAQTLAEEGQELAEQAQGLATAGLSAEDAQDVADCTKKSTDALLPG